MMWDHVGRKPKIDSKVPDLTYANKHNISPVSRGSPSLCTNVFVSFPLHSQATRSGRSALTFFSPPVGHTCNKISVYTHVLPLGLFYVGQNAHPTETSKLARQGKGFFYMALRQHVSLSTYCQMRYLSVAHMVTLTRDSPPVCIAIGVKLIA